MILYILFAHENLAFSMRDFLWRVRREILAVVILQQGFPTRLFAKKCAYWMLNFHVRRYSIKQLEVNVTNRNYDAHSNKKNRPRRLST